jgi:ABC-type multidrug transport system ATPase subunit
MKPVPIERLEFEGLTFGYEADAPLLKDADFDFPMNKIVRVTGDGKSTLLKILCGLLEPVAGAYRIDGRAVSDMSFEDLVPLRLSMGYGFDYGGLLANKTLEENVRLPLDYHGICDAEETDARIGHWFARFDLEAVRSARPSTVSPSRRKAACLVRALIHRPRLLLLDEPVVGLSREAASALVAALEEARARGDLSHAFIVTSDDRLVEAGLFEAEIALANRRIELRAEGEERHAS